MSPFSNADLTLPHAVLGSHRAVEYVENGNGGGTGMDDETSISDFALSDHSDNVVLLNDALRKRRPSASKRNAQSEKSYPPEDNEPPPDAA